MSTVTVQSAGGRKRKLGANERLVVREVYKRNHFDVRTIYNKVPSNDDKLKGVDVLCSIVDAGTFAITRRVSANKIEIEVCPTKWNEKHQRSYYESPIMIATSKLDMYSDTIKLFPFRCNWMYLISNGLSLADFEQRTKLAHLLVKHVKKEETWLKKGGFYQTKSK